MSASERARRLGRLIGLLGRFSRRAYRMGDDYREGVLVARSRRAAQELIKELGDDA